MSICGSGDEGLPLKTALKLAIDAWPPSELERLPDLHWAGAPLRLPAKSRQDLVDILLEFRGRSGI
jgi:hypothetical protein